MPFRTHSHSLRDMRSNRGMIKSTSAKVTFVRLWLTLFFFFLLFLFCCLLILLFKVCWIYLICSEFKRLRIDYDTAVLLCLIWWILKHATIKCCKVGLVRKGVTDIFPCLKIIYLILLFSISVIFLASRYRNINMIWKEFWVWNYFTQLRGFGFFVLI